MWGKCLLFVGYIPATEAYVSSDNRQVMHRATPFSDQMEVRDMRRTTVFDDGPERNGVPPTLR
jgi:hypothetical protein